MESEFHRLAIFRIYEGQDGEKKDELITDFTELKQKTDEIDVNHRHDKAGKGSGGERPSLYHNQGFQEGRNGKDSDQGIIQNSIFPSQILGRRVGSAGGHVVVGPKK